MSIYNTETAAATLLPHVIDGRHLARAKWSKRERAEVAVDLLEGRAVLGNFTKGQIAGLCGCSVSYINTLAKPKQLADALSDQEIEFTECGDELIDLLIDCVGAERIFARLDRLTAAQFAGAAE